MAEQAAKHGFEDQAKALPGAHRLLWQAGIGTNSGRRKLSDEPVAILVKEGWSQEKATEAVELLAASTILRHRKGGWEVVGGSEEDDRESGPEFLELRDLYLNRDVSDSIIDEYVGVSPQVQDVKQRIGLAAEDDDLVLITGESGVGKSIAARLIHRLSSRGNKPFVHLNCSALPEGVLESELFGHERGAFTHALTTHRGCFERAEEGTLFLDEIGEISFDFQKKLLQVLEEGIFFRVGGERVITSSARVIVATNKNLANAVVKKSFRQDLYFRIYGIPVHIPPLRERRDDIPHLVAHYAAYLTKKKGKSYRLTQDAYQLLATQHTWPGNVRELQAVMRMAQRLARHGLISPSHVEFPPLEKVLE